MRARGRAIRPINDCNGVSAIARIVHQLDVRCLLASLFSPTDSLWCRVQRRNHNQQRENEKKRKETTRTEEREKHRITKERDEIGLVS